jgi:hypothetical protein
MNVLPIIVSCKKNEKYWNSILDKNPQAILFYGDPSLHENYNYDEIRRILILKCNDFYEGLPEKMIALISAILELKCFQHVNYIVKIDDHDIINKILNLDYIKHRLNIKPQNSYIGNRIIHYDKFKKVTRRWHFGKCSKGSSWEKQLYKGIYTSWADGGQGYILRRDAMEKIASVYNFSNINDVGKYHIYEDLMIALILNKFKIKPTKM